MIERSIPDAAKEFADAVIESIQRDWEGLPGKIISIDCYKRPITFKVAGRPVEMIIDGRVARPGVLAEGHT
jgi:hypothetical protein